MSCSGCSLLSFEKGDNGVVVRIVEAVVYVGRERPPVARTEHVVDAYDDGITIKRAPQAVAGAHIGIAQALAHAVVRIGDRTVVEVAANEHALAFMLGYKGGDGVDHGSTSHTGMRNF